MRTTKILMMVLALAFSAPLFAQEDTKKDGEEPAKEGEKEAPKREITAEGKSLFEDVERVFAKYYETVLAKVKANEPYKADDVWAEAIKEAKNAKYKDAESFHKAITDMKRKDRVFKKDVLDLTTRLAKENAEAIEKWSKEQKK
ncbi:MAG: hypothetical protein R3E76_09790 [Planctomycetota bacterium]